MRTTRQVIDHNRTDQRQYALRRGPGFWELTFEGRQASFKQEQGALYVVCLLLEPPSEPMHAVALAFKARLLQMRIADSCGRTQGQSARTLDLRDQAAIQALWRRQRELERVYQDHHQIEPVRAEALRELEQLTEFLRQSPWLSRHGAERCVRAVAAAIKGLHARLACAVDAGGKPHPVLRAFAGHLHEHLLVPSGRDGGPGRAQLASTLDGCFTYEPPQGVVWNGGDGV